MLDEKVYVYTQIGDSKPYVDEYPIKLLLPETQLEDPSSLIRSAAQHTIEKYNSTLELGGEPAKLLYVEITNNLNLTPELERQT